MKFTTPILALAAALFVTSCAQNDPEYQQWLKEKREKEANNSYGAPQAPSMVNNNDVNLPSDNPYAAPNNNGITGSVNPPVVDDNGSFQPLGAFPDGTGTPSNPATVHGGSHVNIPSNGLPAGPTISHTVVKGDTVWGLARKYNVTAQDIYLANNLSDSNIRIGQVLQIPQR